MVTIFNVDNSNNVVYIHDPNFVNTHERKLILRSNHISMNENDFILPKYFRISLYDDWDTYDDHVIAKLTGDRGLGLFNVIIDKYLLYNIVNEKDSFIVVGDKVFYLENLDLMSYRTDNIHIDKTTNSNSDSNSDSNSSDDDDSC